MYGFRQGVDNSFNKTMLQPSEIQHFYVPGHSSIAHAHCVIYHYILCAEIKIYYDYYYDYYYTELINTDCPII